MSTEQAITQPAAALDPKTEKQKLEITAFVQAKIEGWKKDNSLVVPPGYAIGNAIQSAYLKLLNTKDTNKQPVLKTCDAHSIAQAMENMCIQGLTVDKNQGYFIAYGTQLTFQRSYFGTIAVSKRFANVVDIVAQVIIEGDEVDTEIINGEERVTKHVRKDRFKNKITYESIIGAYAIVHLRNGGKKWEIMDREQILAAWKKSPSQQATHHEFPDQMAKKTIISRALKILINSSDDAAILVKAFNESGYEEEGDELILGIAENAFTEVVEVDSVLKEVAPEAPQEATKPKDAF